MTEQPGKTVQRIDPAYAASMPAPQGGALPTGLEWQALEKMADTLSRSSVIPYRLKGKPADVAVILLAAREYGIPPLMALSKLPVVNGTPAPMGELMVALILRAGHYIAADFLNPDGTRYAGGPVTPEHYGEARYARRDWPERETLRFTLAEAVTAGLIDRIDDGKAIARVTKFKDGNSYEERTPWEQYTPNMARWRAVANAARLNFADVLLGLSYLPEELGAIVDAEGAPVDVEVVRQAPNGSLEDRTAQESADKLAEQPWHDGVIDALRAKATEGGYLDSVVTYVGETMTFAEALTRHVEDRRHADTVDAELVPTMTPEQYADELENGDVDGNPWDEEALGEIEVEATRDGLLETVVTFRGITITIGGAIAMLRSEARQRERTPTPETAQAAQKPAPDVPEPVPAPEEPQAPAPGPQTAEPGETPQAAALDTANAALASDDREVIAAFYKGSPDLRTVDVAAALTDEDLTTIGINPDDVRGIPVPLGSLLIKVGQYVTKHGNAVRYMGRPTAEDTPLDPWAEDAAAGWPATNTGPE